MIAIMVAVIMMILHRKPNRKECITWKLSHLSFHKGNETPRQCFLTPQFSCGALVRLLSTLRIGWFPGQFELTSQPVVLFSLVLALALKQQPQ